MRAVVNAIFYGFLPTFGDVLRGLVHYVHQYKGDTHCQP